MEKILNDCSFVEMSIQELVDAKYVRIIKANELKQFSGTKYYLSTSSIGENGSVDFAIVNNYGNGRQQYIHYNKSKQTYEWQEQPKGYYQLPEKIEWLKQNGLWGEVRSLYLEKKNNNGSGKKSRMLFAESVNEIYQQN